MTSPAPVILVRDGLAVPLMAALTAMLWYSAYSVSQRVNMHEAMADPVPFSIFVFGLAVMVGLGPLAFVLTHVRIELDGHTLTVRRPARRTVTCSVSDLRQAVFFLSGSAVGVGMGIGSHRRRRGPRGDRAVGNSTRDQPDLPTRHGRPQ